MDVSAKCSDASYCQDCIGAVRILGEPHNSVSANDRKSSLDSLFSRYVLSDNSVAAPTARAPFEWHHTPVLRHLPQPLHAGGLVGWVRPTGADIDLAGDGLVDDDPLLLLQQLNQLLLGTDVAPDTPVSVIEEADDGGLRRKGWQRRLKLVEVI